MEWGGLCHGGGDGKDSAVGGAHGVLVEGCNVIF